MGVPKFYRWMSERYPCLSEVVREYQIPEFDNLYLDMNGIIHPCSHPEDENPLFRITEQKIFENIFHYIEVLFRMIKPRKVLFMAVDGVAPRAKMNQQRSRRFRSARDAEDLVRKALREGQILPREERFDSNCITPGTEFMRNLQEQLKYFIAKKISTDKLWHGVKVYLSGHETPGEGEHKIMDFIRYQRASSDYDPNTRHCLYGLDADLIMLGLVTHDPNFALLREEVKFGKKNDKNRTVSPEEQTFHLLHLSLMREYIDHEFQILKKRLPFEYDVERIIDDWVLMGFLVGNDFIPHLPNMHIHAEALPILWSCYITTLPSLDGYLHDGGELNLPRFEKYLETLSKVEIENFDEINADNKWINSKLASQRIKEEMGKEGCFKHQIRERKLETFPSIPTANQFITVLNSSSEYDNCSNDVGDIEEEEEEEELSEEDDLSEFRAYKDNYYKTKIKLLSSPDMLLAQSYEYIRAIQWILYYYYNGNASWSWFYPFHYAPFLSDVRGFSDRKIIFDLSEPFLPYQQLMAVLPSASKNLLPLPYRELMSSENSPIFDFYPTDFETDLNGKKQDWESVVLIPFIEEARLINAMQSVEIDVPENLKLHNRHSDHLLFDYSNESLGVYENPSGLFPDIEVNHTSCSVIGRFLHCLPREKLRKGLLKGCLYNEYYIGFSTTRHLPHKAELRKENVKVFQRNSQNQNMMLDLYPKKNNVAEEIANELLDEVILVNWPHLYEARVTEVCDGKYRYCIVEDNSANSRNKSINTRKTTKEVMKEDDLKSFFNAIKNESDRLKSRRGVNAGSTNVLVYAAPVCGRKYVCNADHSISLNKQFENVPHPFLWQSIVTDVIVQDHHHEHYEKLDELFETKSIVFMLGSPHYGCMGEVVNIEVKNDDRVRAEFTIYAEPNFESVQVKETKISTRYFTDRVIGNQIGLGAHVVSRLTGSIFLCKGNRQFNNDQRVNIGLNVKFNKRNEEVPGFSKKTEEGTWTYSKHLADDLAQYYTKFPEVFNYISAHQNEENYYEDDIFRNEELTSKLEELISFLKQLPCRKTQPTKCGNKVLDEGVVKEIEQTVDHVKMTNRKKKKRLKMQVRPHLLYRPVKAQEMLIPDPSVKFELYDRIINIRDSHSVPMGLRGTVIGIHTGEKTQDMILDVVFDDIIPDGLTIRCTPGRGYRMPCYALINISHGERKENAKCTYAQKPTAVVKPQSITDNNNYTSDESKNYRYVSSGHGVNRPNEGSQYSNSRQNMHYQESPNSRNNYRYQGNQYESPRNFGDRTSPVYNNPSYFSKTSPYAKNNHNQSGNWSDSSSNSHGRSGGSTYTASRISDSSRLRSPISDGMPRSQHMWDNDTDNADGDFMKLMKALEIKDGNQMPSPLKNDNVGHHPKSKAQFLKEGTAELRKILHIDDNLVTDIKRDEESDLFNMKNNRSSYGKQLSVAELFQGVGNNTLNTSTDEEECKNDNQPSLFKNNINNSHGKRPKLSRVTELTQWCKSVEAQPPVFDISHMQDGKVSAIVSVCTGRYQSSICKNEDQAKESAAGNAILNLRNYVQRC